MSGIIAELLGNCLTRCLCAVNSSVDEYHRFFLVGNSIKFVQEIGIDGATMIKKSNCFATPCDTGFSPFFGTAYINQSHTLMKELLQFCITYML